MSEIPASLSGSVLITAAQMLKGQMSCYLNNTPFCAWLPFLGTQTNAEVKVTVFKRFELIVCFLTVMWSWRWCEDKVMQLYSLVGIFTNIYDNLMTITIIDLARSVKSKSKINPRSISCIILICWFAEMFLIYFFIIVENSWNRDVCINVNVFTFTCDQLMHPC